MLQCVAVYCSVLQCVAVCYRVLQCVAVCCSVLQYVAVYRLELQRVATHCSMLQYACCSVLQYLTVSFSVLQYFAVCYSMLQYVAVCCSVTFIPKGLYKSPIYSNMGIKSLCKEPYLYQRALFTPIGLYSQSPTNATNSPMYTRRALCTHRITQEPNS